MRKIDWCEQDFDRKLSAMKDRAELQPSAALLTAALSGLLVSASACGSAAGAHGAHGSGAQTPDGSATGVLSSVVVADMTEERFTQDCKARNGTVELHAHCGGVNTCRGFSFDDATLALTEHTCRGLNTCSGYSCVGVDPKPAGS